MRKEEKISAVMGAISQQVASAIRDLDKRERTDVGRANPELGAIVRKYRMVLAISIRELSRLSGLNHGFLGRVESGTRGISVHSFALLSRILGRDFVNEYLDEVLRQHDEGH